MAIVKKSITLAGRELSLETGRVAGQADGAVWARYGDTVVLVTATASTEPREGIDFFPLTVDYEERLYAVGRIPGGFIRREGRPSEKAILSARLIDRPLRPLFPKDYRNDVHIVATVLSVDQNNPPDVLAMVGAAAAVTLSGIPFAGPIGAVNVGLADGELVINPGLEAAGKSKMRLTVAGTREAIMMVEAGAAEVSEETILEAIEKAHEEIKKIITCIEELYDEALEAGIARPRGTFPPAPAPDALARELEGRAEEKFDQVIRHLSESLTSKKEREQILEEARSELLNALLVEHPEAVETDLQVAKLWGEIIYQVEKEKVRHLILRERKRIDHRQLDEIRPISVEVGVLPRVHGSALFTRGETQILTAATLGTMSEEQVLDDLGIEETKRYMHHYNMPPYSTGETRPIRGPGRREVGHGALAERALEPVLPGENEFPYAMRLVSEVLSSNGSTSMGSVCGSTLALMDAGVPIKAPVAGVAMGLVKEGDTFAVLTDIQGIEDALGDMDFKVAGTAKGITALQMDIKVGGIDRNILSQALEQAKQGRLFILEKMMAVIDRPRPELSPYAPRIIRAHIDPEKIRDVIGPGGKMIKKIVEETGAKIDIEDDGTVFIASVDGPAGEKALAIIQGLTQEIEVGKVYLGRVTRTTDFGAFVEVLPGVMGMTGKEGLVHISQLAEGRVAKVEDVVREGEQLLVKAIGYDPQGRLRLSHKDALPRAEGKVDEETSPSRHRRGPHRQRA